MDVLLIGSDKSVSGYLPDSLFTVNHVNDMDLASRYMEEIQGGAILLDLSGFHEESSYHCFFQQRYAPVIVLVNEECKNKGHRAVRTGAYKYLIKNEITSRSLSQSIFSATILKEIEMKKEQMNFLSRLKDMDQPFDILFRNIPLGIFILNRERRIIYSNSVVEELVHCTGKELNNHFLTQFLYPDDIPLLISGLSTLDRHDHEFVIHDCRFLSGETDSAWLRLFISSMWKLEEEGDYLLVITLDIDMQKANEDLILTAKKEAEDANRAKTEFLTNMSHEIRTPIHTIFGMTELLLDTSLTKEQKKYINQIRFSSDSLLALINHILDFSRMEGGKLDVDLVEFNLSRMLEDMLDLVVYDVNRKGIELILFIDSAVPELIKGDPVHLYQVVRQLLDNAIKFTEKGEIEVRVVKEEDTGTGIFLRFSVRDSGSGVDRDQINDIFKPFGPTDAFIMKEYGRRGVGLAIVKKVVELLGGSISVKSEKGKGSVFFFDIPLKEYQDFKIESPVEQHFFERVNVLVVMNNTSARKVVTHYLSEWGCSIKEFSIDEFIVGIETNRFSGIRSALCLIDLLSPGVNSSEIVSAIKVKNLFEERLVLLKTPGMYHPGNSLAKEFAYYIVKPVRKRDLFNCMYFFTRQAKHVQDMAGREAAKAGSPLSARVLVVEDHEVNQLFFCTLLNKMGYEVETAANGLEAVEKDNIDSFDLIFMDIQMPKMNGYDATKRFRTMGVKIPIIAVTANTVKGEVSRCLQAGMNDYLAKPFKKSDLVPLLNKWLQNGMAENSGEEVFGTMEKPAVFDFNKAVEMFMGQKDVVLRLLAPFVDRVSRQITHMREALADKEYVVIRNEAHTVKGGALNIQAIEMGNTAAELEKICRENQVDMVDKMIVKFEKTYLRFKEAVETVLAENNEE